MAEATPAESAAVAPEAPAASVATSDELRRAALERSAARNAQISRQRVRRRWLSWVIYKLLLFTLPLLILAELAWVLWWRDHPLPRELQQLANELTGGALPQAKSPSSAAPGSPAGEH
jgi:hypothetical protein